MLLTYHILWKNYITVSNIREKIGKKTILDFIMQPTFKKFKNSLICFSTLSVVQYFTVDFICTYQMNRYPFDIQKCNGTLEPKKNSDFFVKLVPKYLSYNGPTDLMKYQLETNISFTQTDNVKIKYILYST